MNSLGTAVARLGEIDARPGLPGGGPPPGGRAGGGQGRGAGLRQPVRPARRPGPAGGVGGRGHRGDRGGHGGGPAADLRRLPGRQRRRLPVPPGPLGRDGRAHRRLPGAGRRREPQHGHPAPVPGGAGRRPGRLRGRPGPRPGGQAPERGHVHRRAVPAGAGRRRGRGGGLAGPAGGGLGRGGRGAWPPCRARCQDLRACMLLASGCGSRATGPGWPPPATTTARLADARLVAGELVRWARATLDEPAVAWRRALLATCEAE